MTWESQVLVPALLSTSNLLICNMGLILPAMLAVATLGKNHMRTWL